MHPFKTIHFIALSFMTMMLVSCDEHQDFPDTTSKVCDILCTDGKVVSQSQYDQGGKEAIAVVFYINHSEDVEGKGFAVYLWDIGPFAFADSLGVKQGTSTSETKMDGNQNTDNLLECKDMGSPMATAVFDMWKYRQSAYVPIRFCALYRFRHLCFDGFVDYREFDAIKT